ncbi:Lcl C-terminal domain-containing protein [Aliiglaciecola aliphaticivorans]
MKHTLFRRHSNVLVVIIFALIMTGCSGSSLDSDTDQPTPDVLVNAGANQSVNEQSTVVLSATAQGTTDTLTYTWSASPALTITQEDVNSSAATFVAPTTTENLTYVLTLVVTDENGNQGSDTVEYVINPVNEQPSALIEVLDPVTTGSYPAGIEVTLDGSTSSDVDPADSLDPIAAWRWQQTAGVEVLDSVSLDGDSIAFITPILDDANSLSFELTVTDQEGAQDTAAITLNVLSASQTQPVVDAGVDHQVYSGEIILLTGEASTSIPEGLPLVYDWLNDSELVPDINNRSAQQTYAVAPLVTQTELITFTLVVTDSFGNEVEDSINVRIKPLPISNLNDTGVTLQASVSENGTGHQPDYPGQDGQRGQDIISENGLLEKAGRGEQGFDFTKLDAIGDEQDETSEDWSCVRDNTTGLVWEVKTDDSELHGAEHAFSWYQEDLNGGYEGAEGSAGLTCDNDQCDTESFVAAVNQAGLCNFYDWRLPTHNELLSLVHYGNVTGTKIDVNYFPYTDDFVTSPLWYWTSQPSADGVSDDTSQTAWAIDFSTGNDNFLNKSTLGKVRLVRGGR